MEMSSAETSAYIWGESWSYVISGCSCLPAEDSTSGPAPTCPRCGACTGMLRWEGPLVAEVTCPHYQRFDELWAAGAGNGRVVSQRFIDFWMAAGLTPFPRIDKIDLYRRGEFVRDATLYLVEPELNRGRINDRASKVVRKQSRKGCPVCGGGSIHYIDGVRFDGLELPDADAFLPVNFPDIVLSARAGSMISTANLRGVVVIPAELFGYTWNFKKQDSKMSPLLPRTAEYLRMAYKVYNQQSRT